jgi:bacterioferritin
MRKRNPTTGLNVTRARMIRMLNQDLVSEYQAIVAFIVYSQILKRAAYADIARELELHAAEDFQHARDISNQIACLGGTPCIRLSAVNTPNAPVAMLLSKIVQNREYQIDMASLPGMDRAGRRGAADLCISRYLS